MIWAQTKDTIDALIQSFLYAYSHEGKMLYARLHVLSLYSFEANCVIDHIASEVGTPILLIESIFL